MITKRRVIAGVIIFIFASLLLFTFANPSKVNEGPSDNEKVVETEKEKDVKKEETKEVVKEEKKEEVVNNNTNNTNNNTTNNTSRSTGKKENVINKRLVKLTELMSLITKNEEDYTTDSFKNYKDIINELVKDGKINTTNLTEKQLDNYIDRLKEAIENLVDLKLVELTISSNNDEYKRLDSQKELVFTAIYNDELRNKDVDAISNDLFDTNLVAQLKTMNYTYSDKYGSADALYSYSVVKNDRDLLLDKLEEVKNTEINEEDYTTESVDNLNNLKDTDTTDLTKEEIEELINKIEESIENLVKLELTGLEVSSNNDEYKRLDSQKELTFKAIYNDELRNKNVDATTNDTFDSSKVIEKALMTYTYSDSYGNASVEYIYSVVKNERDLLLDKLEELLNKEINEEDYTTESVDNLKDAKDVDATDLTDEELEQAIEKIEEAINNLVELKLIKLEVSSNNDEYKRFENQKELTFTAIYNDELRNKNVNATTEDTFDSSKVNEKAIMKYSYSDNYGNASIEYIYSVVKNDRDLELDELINKEINEEDYTTESVDNLKEAQDVDPTDLSEEEVEEAIQNIEDALENLVELELKELVINPNNGSYKRGEKQDKLTFTAIYNDELRNKNVNATTEDTFDTSKVIEVAAMNYSYSDKYGSVEAIYTYSVEKNERDLYLDRLINQTFDKDVYTTESIENVKELQEKYNVELTIEEVEEAIEKIEEAINNLVEIKLLELKLNTNNDEYKRGETQKELIFTAIYNDESRNTTVDATTEDTFSTADFAENKTMIYAYTDTYGTASIDYNYSVVENERDLYLVELIGRTFDKDVYTSESINNVKEAQKVNPKELTIEEVEETIEKIEKAINELEEIKLVELQVSSNNDEYKRGENQKELTFTAIYNDESRNTTVDATTEDTFSTAMLSKKSTMSYTYSDTYGTKSVIYNYSVVENERDLYLIELINKTFDKDVYTAESINNVKETQKVNPKELTIEEVEEAIEKIEKAINELEEIKLVELQVSSNNDEYKREENQKELIFTAIYNDETRNVDNTVVPTTEDTFDSSKTATAKSMTYTYTNRYGTASIEYKYSVVKNDRDLLLEELEELLNVKINEEDYTTKSVNNYNESKNIDPDKLSDEELKEAIQNIKDAYNNLEELKLTGLLVSSNNDEYKRKDNQKELVFTAIYNDELRNKNVNATTEDTFDSESNGSKSMTYVYTDKYGSKSVVYNYTVVRNDDDKVIASIEAELSNSEFGYLTEVNIKDYLTVYEVAKDGVKTTTTDYSVEGFTTSELTNSGKLTVIKGELTDELTYSVVRTEEGKQLKSLSVKLDKENYNWKDTNYTKTVTATDNDGISYDVSNEVEIIKEFDTNTVGEKEFEVSYTKGDVTKTAKTTYNVLRTNAGKVLDYITAELSKTDFERLTKEDVKDSLTVTAFDKDGTSYVLAKNNYKTSKFDVSKVGEKSLTITYTKNGVKKTTTVKYNVVKNANDLKIKSVKATLSKKEYNIEEEIEGLEVEVTRGDGTKEKIDTCSNDFNSGVAGYNKTLTVTCDGVNGKTTYSVKNEELKGIKATLNRTDGKYTENSEISVKVEYIDEYNRSTEVNKNNYSISPKLSTEKAGSFKSKITYKTYETEVSYVVSEEFLFELKIIDDMLVEMKESYNEFIDITEIKVTYTDNKTKSFKANKDEIEMVSYESKNCGLFTCVYTKPVYRTDKFDMVDGKYKEVAKIEVFYGKAKNENSKYHAYKLTYSVTDGKVKYIGSTDLNKEYY